MAGIGEAILSMMGQKDPRLAMLQAMQAGGAPSAPQPAASAPDAQGTDGGATAPAQPQAYQSPPELAQLYGDLLKYQRKSSLIDQGVGLIGSSLAQEQNRQGILQAFSGGNGGSADPSDPSSFLSVVSGIQKQQQAIQEKAAMRARLPAIAKRYNLDEDTAAYLLDTGKLDSVIAEAEKPNKQITQDENGQHYIVDLSDGSVSEPFGNAKKREVELVDDPISGGKIAVYKDDKSRVGAGDIAGAGNTADQQNYNAAMRDLPEDQRPGFGQWLLDQSKSKTTTINVGPTGVDYGKPPTDMSWVYDKDGKVQLDERGVPKALPIGGTELASKGDKAADMEKGNASAKTLTNDIVTQNIDDAIEKIKTNSKSWLPVTGAGSYLSGVRGTDAYDTAALLDTVKANLGFDKLQQMRQSSPTGAALGPVSDFENKLLQSVIANVDMGQGEPQLLRNLQFVKRVYSNGTINKVKQGIVDGSLVDKDGRPTPKGEALEQELSQAVSDQLRSEESDKDVPIDDLLKKYGD